MSWNAKRYRVTRHHLTPKERFKKARQKVDNSPSNILMLKEERHQLLHKIFGNLTLEEIIAVLQRISRMKHRGEPAPMAAD